MSIVSLIAVLWLVGTFGDAIISSFNSSKQEESKAFVIEKVVENDDAEQVRLNASYQKMREKINLLGYSDYGGGILGIKYHIEDGRTLGSLKDSLYNPQFDWKLWDVFSDVVLYRLDDAEEAFTIGVIREKNKVYAPDSYLDEGFYAIQGSLPVSAVGDVIIFVRVSGDH